MQTYRTKPRILVVDDETMVAQMLARHAIGEGYDAECAANGEDAWAKLGADHYDVVVTDLKMPEVDGPELMVRIGGLPDPPKLIAITGYASLEVAVDCLRKGAADFLVKPFDVNDFSESLKKVLSRTSTPVFRDPEWDDVEVRYCLTRRQREVLAAFYRTGKSNRELADELYLSPHTVKSHLRVAFEKIGVDNRAQLIRALHG